MTVAQSPTPSPPPSAGAARTSEAIWARGLGKTLEEREILSGVDLEVARGTYVALLGANGAGKSTLLKILSMLTAPTAGELRLFGEKVSHAGPGMARLRGRIGVIGHQAMLYPDLSARENLVFFGKLYGVAHVPQRAAALLARMGLAERADDPVKAFSRGMMQRVAIARALMHDPQLLLADEPFAGLDAPSTDGLESVLAELHRAGKTIILANHDIAQTLRLVQEVTVLRAGRVVARAAAGDVTAGEVLGYMNATPRGGPA